MRSLTAFLAYLFALQVAVAQDVLVRGTVVDDSGGALPGVTVSSSAGSTITDIDGNFEIRVSDSYQTLTFTFPDHKVKKVSLNGQTQVSVSLQTTSTGETVSTGFGSQSREESTSAISQIKGDALGTQPVIDIEQSSQGRAAGVFIQNSGGQLGQGTKVRIRGGSSLTGSNEPLYVVDGVPLTSGNQSDIDPGSVASIEILKDAAATSLYGSRAANGVVLITTKKGQSGKLKVDLDYQFGISTLPKRLDLMTPEEYNQLFIEYNLRNPFVFPLIPDDAITQENLTQWGQEAMQLQADYPDSTYQINFSNGNNISIPLLAQLKHKTDWQDEAFRNASSHRITTSLSGGSEKHQFYTNLNYLNQDGILIGNNYERFGGRFSLNSRLGQRLESNLSVNYVKTNNNKLNEDADIGNPVQMILLPSSDAPDPDNNYILEVRSLEYNPQTEVYNSLNFETSDRVNGNLSLTYDLSENLLLNIDGGIDYLDLREERRQGPATQEGNPTGLSRLGTTSLFNYLVNGYLDYEKTFGSNTLQALGGISYQSTNSTFTFRRARINSISELENLSGDDPSLLANPIPGSAFAFESYFGRLNYSFNEKYMFQASFRVDGSSKFGPENQYGIFPAVSAGWNITEESFLQGNTILNFLKLTASYGLVGNTPEDDFLYRNNYFTVTYGNSDGIRLANLGNRKLKWETTSQADLGIAFGFFDHVISGSLNYYYKNTTDLLFPVPVSQVSGFSNVINNTGSLVNYGLELALSSVNVQQGGFAWTTDFNISTNQNEVKDLKGQRLISGVNAFFEGEPAGVFYMVEYAGVDSNGDPLYINENGFTTTDYNDALENGRRVVGNPNPKFFGGLTNNLSYGAFDLSFTFQFVQGIDLYWETGEFISNSGFGLYNQTADQVNRWYQTGDNAENPAVNPILDNTNPSSRWLVDGSYIRLNTLNLSYTLPDDMLSGVKLRVLSFYVGAQNLFTISDYPGYNPDVSYSDPEGGTFSQNINRGIDFFTAPQPRVYVTGVKIGF